MTQVFIFGDSNLEVQGLMTVLEESGYKPALAPRPWEELEGSSTEGLCLIFLDVPYLRRAGADVESLISLCRSTTRARLIALLAPDKPQGFDIVGKVDDFITLPYHRHEVLARVRQALGGEPETDAGPGKTGPNILARGQLVIDRDRYEVWVARKRVGLTYKEYELLTFLASNPGKVFPRDVLLDKVWGYDYFGGTRTVDVHIRRLRSKIEVGGLTFIETVRGVGYRFDAGRLTEL